MKRKLTIPAALTEQIKAQKKKLEAALAKCAAHGKNFDSSEADAERFEQEAAALELKTDYSDDAALEKIDRLRRKARMARTKSEGRAPLDEEIAAKIVKELEVSEPLIKAALIIEKDQMVEEITAKLMPYFHDAHAAKGTVCHYVPIVGLISGQITNAYRIPVSGNFAAVAEKHIQAMEQLLAGFSPVKFVSAADSEDAGE